MNKSKSINKRIDELHQRRNEAHAQQRKLEEADLADFDVSLIDQRDAATRRRFELMRDELTLRRELVPLYKEIQAGLSTARGKAVHEKTKVFAKVKEKLVSIGYVDTGDKYDNHVPGSIAPGDIQKHPDALAAWHYERELSHTTWPKEHANQNAKAKATLQTHLTQFRTQTFTG